MGEKQVSGQNEKKFLELYLKLKLLISSTITAKLPSLLTPRASYYHISTNTPLSKANKTRSQGLETQQVSGWGPWTNQQGRPGPGEKGQSPGLLQTRLAKPTQGGAQ